MQEGKGVVGDASTSVIDDVRQYAGARAVGTYRFIYLVHPGIEDLVGAVASDRLHLLPVQTRVVVHQLLGIRSLFVGGVTSPGTGRLSFDAFHGLTTDEVDDGLRLVHRACDVAASTVADVDGWLDDVRAFASATEDLLGHPGPLPQLRTPKGLFPSLRMARRWSVVLTGLGLPPLFPEEWISAPDGTAPGTVG